MLNLWRTTFLAFVWLILSLAGTGKALANCDDPFAKPNEVLDFHVKFKTTLDWQSLVADPAGPHQTAGGGKACTLPYKEFPAEFRCGDAEPWIKIGVRKKRGEESGVETVDKPFMKLDFNEDFMGAQPEAKGQRWPAALGLRGYRKLTLNNGQGNRAGQRITIMPSLMTEHVALRLLKREVPETPSTAFAKIWIHTPDKPDGEYRGIYILIEDIDRERIKERWGYDKAQGKLWKASKIGCNPDVDYDDDAALGMPNAATKAAEEWFKKKPANFPGTWLAETKKAIDVETLLRQEAMRELMFHTGDTIIAQSPNTNPPLGNNYYAFDPETSLGGGEPPVRKVIPWDLDLSFGHSRGCLKPLECLPDKAEIARPLLLGRCGNIQLSLYGKQTVCVPEIQRRYFEIMCQLINGSLKSDKILALMSEVDQAIRPVVRMEPANTYGGHDPLALAPSPDPDAGAGDGGADARDGAAPGGDGGETDATTDVLPIYYYYPTYGSDFEFQKTWVPARIEGMRVELNKQGAVLVPKFSCPLGCQAGAEESCTYLVCPGKRTCMNDEWTTCIPNDPACGFAKPPEAGPDGGVEQDAGATDANKKDANTSGDGRPGTQATTGGSSGCNCAMPGSGPTHGWPVPGLLLIFAVALRTAFRASRRPR